MTEKKDDKRRLYFIAIIPPTPFFEEALKAKQYFAEHYSSRGALKSPPHITLRMPFMWKEEKEDTLISAVAKFSEKNEPIQIQFNHFGCFPPRVIFIDVKKSEPLNLIQRNLQLFCKQELNLFNANDKEFAFNPHLTVAFRDLKKSAFQKAWEEFREKKFEGEFIVETVTLLKHSGKQWETLTTFHLTRNLL